MKIPHNRPSFDQREELAACRVLQSAYVAQGPEVEAFEDEICRFLKLPSGHAVAVSSGTAALYLALYALDSQEKRIAMSSYVCSAVRNAVKMIQGHEKLVDLKGQGLDPDYSRLKDHEYDQIIHVHMYGRLSPLPHHKPVIEDCAQSFGARYPTGEMAGTLGELGIYSFYATKLLTTGGQGGMVVSKNKKYIDKIKDFRLFDCRKDNQARFNFQMTDLQAAIGREQLKKWPQFLSRRWEIFHRYKKELPLTFLDCDEQSIPYRMIALGDQVDQLKEKLNSQGIGTINPLEEWELLGPSDLFPNAKALCQRTLSLPLYPSLNDEQVKKIIDIIKESL